MELITSDPPKTILSFDETHVGYWTGDHESACFNPISSGEDYDPNDRQASHDWYNACTYIGLPGLEPGKKYKVTLHVEAEEIA